MRDCWYVVDIYFGLAILRVIESALRYADTPAVLAFAFASFLLVVALTVFSYRGSRLASRMLSLHILLNSAATVAMFVTLRVPIDVYISYKLLVEAYFIFGAIKLWRMKELPTRFTDPPEEPPTKA